VDALDHEVLLGRLEDMQCEQKFRAAVWMEAWHDDLI